MQLKNRISQIEKQIGINTPKPQRLKTPSFDAYYETLSPSEKAYFDNHPPLQNSIEWNIWLDKMSAEMKYQYDFGLFEGWLLQRVPNYYELSNDERIKLAEEDKILSKHNDAWSRSAQYALNRGDLSFLYEELNNDQIHDLLGDLYKAEQTRAK